MKNLLENDGICSRYNFEGCNQSKIIFSRYIGSQIDKIRKHIELDLEYGINSLGIQICATANRDNNNISIQNRLTISNYNDIIKVRNTIDSMLASLNIWR